MEVQLEATRTALELRMDNSRVERRECDGRLDLSLETNVDLREELLKRDRERDAILEEQAQLISSTANLRASVDEMAEALSNSVVYESEAKRLLERYEAIGSALGVLIDEDALEYGVYAGHISIDLDADRLFGGSIQQMSQRGQEMVHGIGQALEGVRGLELVVAGHTGRELPEGAEESTPLEVSMARAAAVHELLLSAGIRGPRLSVAAFGPRSPGTEPADRLIRRVTLRVSADYDNLPGARELEGLLRAGEAPDSQD